MTVSRSLLVALVAVGISASVMAQDSVGVAKVTVSAPGDVRSLLESAINRELRNLPDLIVDESRSPNWVIVIHAVPVRLEAAGDIPQAFAVSTVFIERRRVLPPYMLDILSKSSNPTERHWQFARDAVEMVSVFKNDSLAIIYETGIKHFATQVVSQFETDILETQRSAARQLRNRPH